MTDWGDDGLLSAMAVIGGVAFVLAGVSVARGAVVARWTGWPAVAFGALLAGQVVVGASVIPALRYLAPFAIGVAALIRAVRPPRPLPG
jgi:hypothetical protein